MDFNSKPSKNGTPPTVCNGVQFDTPANSSAGSPRGLRDYEDYERLGGLRKTERDSEGVPDGTARDLFNLPWEQFLVEAHKTNQEHFDAIDSDGDYLTGWQLQTPLFGFVHFVWSRPDLGPDAHRPAAVFTKIESTLKRWSANYKRQRKEPPNGFTGDAWEEWFGVSREEAKTEFLDLWSKFRWPANQTPLEAAVLRARRNLLIPNDEVCERRMVERNNPTIGYCFFLSVCGHLQVMLGDQTIFLPQDGLAKLLRVQGRTISRWRQWAIEDGMLRQTEPPGRRRAARYRFDISRYGPLTEKAYTGTAEGFAK